MKFGKVFLAALLAVVVGSILSGLFWVITLIGSLGSFGGETVVVPQKAILKIDLADNITDSPNVNPLSGFDYMTMTSTRSFTLLQTLRALEAAAADARIQGIYINFAPGGTIGLAQLEELRAALIEFKKSGKFVVAFNDTYGQIGYYFATVADKIYIQPEGGMEWKGMASVVPFFKNALDKLGISVEVYRPTVCKYKSAVEPYILDKMSDANRQQMQRYDNAMWDVILGDVATARSLDKAALNRLADNKPMLLADEALEAKLVDGVIYRDQMNEIFAELGAERNLLGEYEFITLGDYTSTVKDVAVPTLPKVGIIYAEGEIVDGETDMPDGKIYGNMLADVLAKARKDDSIKSVVLRVNSPGGSALASDVIWREVELLKAVKPVVVSMGNYAASGGYYISAPSDAIVCNRTTLTGSIGVFGLGMEGGNLLSKKLGVTFDTVKTNRSADMGNGVFGLAIRRNTPHERAMMMRSVDKVYTAFTDKVAKGRNLDIKKVLDIAEGRVWCGTDAVEIGLSDGLGGLKTAISLAADRAGIADGFRIEEIMGDLSPMAQFFQTLGVQARVAMMSDEELEYHKAFESIRQHIDRSGVQAYCPYRVSMQ